MSQIFTASLIAACALIVADSAVATGKETKIPRVGFVAGAGGYPRMAVTNQAFFDALAEKGYKDGTTMQVVFRSANGNMAEMPELVRQVLNEQVDILVVSSSPGCAAASKATTEIPVLCISVQDDPIREGFTRSLERGEANVVGVHSYLPDGVAQQLSGLQVMKPGVARLAVLFNPGNNTHLRLLGLWKTAAQARDITIIDMAVTGPRDLDAVASRAIGDGAEMAIGLLGADTYAIRREIADMARAKHFPVVMDTPGGYTDMGGVATLGVDIVPLYREGALKQMVPMLEGTVPSQLPWIGPEMIATKFNSEALQFFKLQQP